MVKNRLKLEQMEKRQIMEQSQQKFRFLIKYFPRPEKPDQHDCHSDKQITD